MARANGIPAKDVYEIDASRQTTRMSANVSGFANTMRITLNDNLLRRGSPEEIQAVMGHEMGHYVLNHIYKGIMFCLIVTVLAFAYLRWGLDWTLQRWGEKWQIRGVGDTAVLPLVVLLVSIFGFVTTPVDEHLHPHAGIRSRHVRSEHEPAARWFCPGGDPSRRIPQDESRARSKSGFSSIIPADAIAFTPRCAGRPRI